MKSAMGAIVVLVAAAACAPTPESITPAYVSELPFRSYTCEQLGEEQARLNQALATASSQQNTARTNDVMGLILIKLPVGSLSGQSVAPQISFYKGSSRQVHARPIATSVRKRTAINQRHR